MSAEATTIGSPNPGFVVNLLELIDERVRVLYRSILADSNYLPKNSYSVRQKMSILNYLQSKSLGIVTEMKIAKKPVFHSYDPEFDKENIEDADDLKRMILRGRTEKQKAKANLERRTASKKQLQYQFLTEQAMEFERARRNSIAWGLVFAAAFNTFFYRKGSTIRRLALFFTVGHLMGQTSYEMNIDRYFDSVYELFEEDAKAYVSSER